MQPTLVLSAFAHVGLYTLLTYNDLANYYILLGFVFNFILLLRIFIQFGLKYTTNRLLRGQILPFFLYMVWLILYPQDEHLFKIPILLSCLGKTYLLLTSPEQLGIDSIQNLIILQSQTELFMVFYLFFKLMPIKSRPTIYLVIQYILFVLIIKLKFEIHYGTRKAFESIHFSMDRCSKLLKFRSLYHLIQRIISGLGGQWQHSKIITY